MLVVVTSNRSSGDYCRALNCTWDVTWQCCIVGLALCRGMQSYLSGSLHCCFGGQVRKAQNERRSTCKVPLSRPYLSLFRQSLRIKGRSHIFVSQDRTICKTLSQLTLQLTVCPEKGPASSGGRRSYDPSCRLGKRRTALIIFQGDIPTSRAAPISFRYACRQP